MAKKKPQAPSSTIALNKKAKHDYFLEDRIEAGIALQGWEVKSLREGKLQMVDCYVIFKNGEAFLLGALISPLNTTSTHIFPDPTRTRKLLMHAEELYKLQSSIDRKGFTLLATAVYWKKGMVKVELALGKGKKQHDKRATEKERDWDRQKNRIMKEN
ncbi:SsrA-binding protein SmpB [Pelagibaculum spongiae]|uniref:SsrA-binding protein n=1 Tax=Pelagibaculum spongiae TaxID=2080658 RepID=A0A2V1H0K3_9GAMM|nr:SsrA-binding protein SmpB [Pelagibaculum spongiae]PVZ72003.1 SsrA-binding protein [Pelagibaculum spongiae]